MPPELKTDDLNEAVKGLFETTKSVLETTNRRLDELEATMQKAALDEDDPTRQSEPAGPFLGREQKAAPHFAGIGDLSEARDIRLGALVAAQACGLERLGDSLSDTERKSVLAGQTGGGGGFLVPESVGALFIDAARNRTVVLRAGARTFPMNTPEVRLPGWDTPPSAAWRGETGAFAEPTASFRAVWLRAKTLAATVPITLELFEDSASNLGPISEIIEDALERAAAVEIDRAALDGAGTDHEPLGLLNTPGVTGPTGVGGLTYDDLIALHFNVMEENHENRAFILAPRDEENLAEAKEATTNAYLAPPAVLAPVPRYVTNNVPQTLGGGSNESVVFAGDWSKLVIGVRPSLSLRTQLDPYTKMATAGEYVINAYLRCDVAVLDTSAFSVASGVTA